MVSFGDSIIVGRRRRSNARFPLEGGVTYLLRDEFTTDASAPLPATEDAVPGPGTATNTDTANQLSRSGSTLVQSGTPTTPYTNPRRVYNTMTRVAGRALLWKWTPITSQSFIVGFHGVAGGSGTNYQAAMVASGAILNGFYGSGGFNAQIGSFTVGVDYAMALVMAATGAYFFCKGGSEYPDWTLLIHMPLGANANLYPTISYIGGSGNKNVKNFRIADLPVAFSQTYGLATLNIASPVSGNAYAGDADGVYLMTITAPNPLLGTTAIGTELRYRIQDASNYWTVYLREDGAIAWDRVQAGTPVNQVVVAGIATNGSVTTICVVTKGNTHNLFEVHGGVMTKRGSTVTSSFAATQSTLQAQIGTNWAAATLVSLPSTSPLYGQLNLFLA